MYFHLFLQAMPFKLGMQRHCAGQGEGGAEPMLRATERVRQAALPVYTNLFTPISNQPQGGV